MTAAVLDARHWALQVGHADDLPRTAKHVGCALQLLVDGRGRGAAPMAQLMRLTGYGRGVVLRALKALREGGWLRVLVPHRRAAGSTTGGLATVYQVTTPDLLDAVEVPGEAPLLGGGGRRGEDPLPPRTHDRPLMTTVATGPAAADAALCAAVPAADVDHVIGHLPTQLRPRDLAERARYDRYVRQRIVLGRTPQWLVAAAATCETLPKTSPLGLWTAHVDRAWDEHERQAVNAAPKRPKWCEQCDERTRFVLDENGYPSAGIRCDCHPASFATFVSAS